jgi:hypothetical protein
MDVGDVQAKGQSGNRRGPAWYAGSITTAPRSQQADGDDTNSERLTIND